MSVSELSSLDWSRLRKETGSGQHELGIPSVVLTTSTEEGPVRLALGEDGQARVLLPVAAGAPFPSIVDSRGLTMRDSVFTAQGRAVRFIDIACRDADLEEVFRNLVAEILERLRNGDRADVAVESAVSDFRALLLGTHPKKVSPEAALGLLGELTILVRLLSCSPCAWRGWTGPKGARHDFRMGPIAFEVKSTARRFDKTVTITALDQLLEPPDGELVLFWFQFEQESGGNLSVPDLAQQVLAMADDAESVDRLLLSAGYDSAEKDAWAAWRFSLLFEEAYSVREGFPRLVPADVGGSVMPVGISRFRYDLDLAAAKNFVLNVQEIESVVQQMALCAA